MTRPSRNHDKALIAAGKKLLPELGASGMSIQKIAKEAGVNVGMFHYHFKTKSNFIKKVIESMKEDGEIQYAKTLPDNATSIEKFRHLLILKTTSFRDNRKVAIAMYRDFLNLDLDIADFLISNTNAKMETLSNLITQCQNDGFITTKIPVEQIIQFIVGCLQTPVVMHGAIERLPAKISKRVILDKKFLLSDEAMIQRVDMALKGISP